MTVVRMWEGVVLPGRLAEAQAWLRDEVVPSALATTGCRAAEAYVAEGAVDDAEARVVVVTRWDDPHAEDFEEGTPPFGLLRRSHAWGFSPLRRPPGEVRVRAREPRDDALVDRVLTSARGGPVVVSRGTPRDAGSLPGLVAEDDAGPLGLLTWHADSRGLQVVTVDALVRGRGVGRALLDAAQAEARRQGADRLWLVTTNDNTGALAFSQRCGLRLVALHTGAVDEARERQRWLPVTGEGGVPIRDELELAAPL